MLGMAREQVAPLLGREEEQRLLASLLDEVATRGQALVLRSEPGIGKSRLLSEAANKARERGMAVLAATGVQSEAHLPFAGLHQLLRPVRERALELPRIQRDALDAAFGLTDEVAPELYRIAMAVLDLISDVAGDSPLLLVVDDAQWLDRPSADVLAFVARRIESDPVLLLVAARDGYASALADAGLPEHRLTCLDDETAATLLDVAAPGLALTTRSDVLSEAAGNPLALLELPAASGQNGDAQRLSGALPLTERLERAFAGHVSDLPDATRLVLLVAALSDADAVGEVLQAASAVAGTSLEVDALEPAVDAALIDVDVSSIRFRHPLIRSAVEQSAGLKQRRHVHEALAAVLEADPDRRVWHRAALMSGTDENLARELEEAGARARRRGAVDIAIPAAEEACRLATEFGQPAWLATAETAVAIIGALRGDPGATERATTRVEQLAMPLGATHLVALAQFGPILSALSHGRHAEAFRYGERLFDPEDAAYHLDFACMGIGDLAEAAAVADRLQAARRRVAEVEAMVGDAPAEWMAISLRHARAVLVS